MSPFKKYYFLYCFLLLVASNRLYAQPHYFRHYQVEAGLSNNAVICTLQDYKGFLWIGTKDGLNRFDGYNFKVFRYNADDSGSIGSNFIHCLLQDSTGIIWVGTEEGLFQYHEKTETFSPVKGTPASEIREIKMDKQHNLWFIADLILYKYDLKTALLKMYSPTEYFQATSISITREGNIWIATPSGLIEKYDDIHDKFIAFNVFDHSPVAASQWIEKLYAIDKGRIFIGTSNQGVKLFDSKTGKYTDILTYNDDKTAIFAREFLPVSDHEYWIGTESGIFIYNIETGAFQNLKKQYNDPYSLSDNAVYTFCKDKEGGIWTGTYFGGLNYYPKQYTTFEKIFPKTGENSISGNAVREICPDQYGNLWIGTEDGGLNRFDKETNHFTSFKPKGTPSSISNVNIHGLLVTGDTLWIGTFEHGLDLMNIKTGKVIKHYTAGPKMHNLKSNFIYCMYQLRGGNIILGTASGLYQYDKTNDNFISLYDLPKLFFTTILEDKEGKIWAGTYRNGLYYIDPSTKKVIHFKNNPNDKHSLTHNRINYLLEDHNGDTWIATEGGLCKLSPDKKKFKRFTIENGLPGNVIYAMLEDNRNNLWISTSKGLACFSLLTEQIKTFSTSNGLLSDQFNYNSAYKSPDGTMYFGSVKGMIRFNPDSFIKVYFHPPVYITGFQVFNEDPDIGKKGSPLNKSIILSDTLILKNKQSTFNIDFAALSYTSPRMTKYTYKLEGLDNAWTNLATNRKVFFTKLPPGHYTFRVKAANSSGVWNKDETRLHIHILPPFWKSWPAYLLYCIVIGISIFLIIRGYHRKLKAKQVRRLELFEHEKEKEIYQAKIEFFTNVAHEIRTPLTLIKGPMEKVIRKADQVPEIRNNLKIMERNTERLLALTGQLLDFRRTETNGFSLNFVKADIVILLQDILLQFKPAAEQKSIHLKSHIHLSHFNAYVDKEALKKIVSNLIDNAIKYAHSEVHICLSSPHESNKYFSIEIKNDGFLIPYDMKEKIFEIFFRLKNTEKQGGTGIGLPLSRSLTELHKGILELIPSENNMNVFKLTLPIRHQIEFDPVMS